MYHAILFDLDGTLTDSGEGIIKSVQYALEKMGRPEDHPEKLRCFVGPPLKSQFMLYAGFSDEEAQEAVRLYRERYVPVGIYENEVYSGIPEMLQALRAKGYRLAVASSKPEVMVRQVLDRFALSGYFEVMVGSRLDGTLSTKPEVIEEALRRMGLDGHREQVIMVGDTHYDVEGAKQASLSCIAVTYGYDDPALLSASGPEYTASSPRQILDFFS